jgi:hypothetical protein
MTEVEIFKESLDVSRIVMLITIVMTIISATFSALTLAFQRSHNKKTVKPLCDAAIIVDRKNPRIDLKNAGLGPMIVRNVTITEPDRGEMTFSDFCESLIAEKADSIVYKKTDNMILSANEQRTILELNREIKLKQGVEDFVFARLSAAELKIEYSDIYDKSYTCVVNSKQP